MLRIDTYQTLKPENQMLCFQAKYNINIAQMLRPHIFSLAISYHVFGKIILIIFYHFKWFENGLENDLKNNLENGLTL